VEYETYDEADAAVNEVSHGGCATPVCLQRVSALCVCRICLPVSCTL